MKRSLTNRVTQLILMGLFVAAAAYIWSNLKRDDQDQQVENGQFMRRAIVAVLNSSLGSQQARDEGAGSLSDEKVHTGNCQWSGYRLWDGMVKNPNWFSSTKRADGYHLICYASAEIVRGDSLPEVRFDWDYAPGGFVTSFTSRYSGRNDPEPSRGE